VVHYNFIIKINSRTINNIFQNVRKYTNTILNAFSVLCVKLQTKSSKGKKSGRPPVEFKHHRTSKRIQWDKWRKIWRIYWWEQNQKQMLRREIYKGMYDHVYALLSTTPNKHISSLNHGTRGSSYYWGCDRGCAEPFYKLSFSHNFHQQQSD